ncbi:RNA-binding domain-containing protein [Basidiobolus meristosporus CBS 931.73]|uniref:RNA-binding domain-containing protein n=1 Tax=Basidiobolus meristosporus CBS 931.73 TaxID=1314790 RepID=A0A1Y1YU48_9FUNG|nr:RNA-binding domain-containing protein [Basidiobolus meristosporus CBS 931.73]|eukprot:ORY01562.1 RNA-binding domain-containing protein [Basidiobolus meristosporus CBS 931.73]
MWYAKTYVPLQAGSIDGTDTVPHDHAVQRAQRARYIPPNDKNNVVSDPYKTLFVGRLNPETTEETLSTFFSRYGALNTTTLTRNIVTGDSRGYGFVEFQSERACRDAYMNANKATLDGRQILVDYERGRVMEGWIPRRLGGGFGGRKESGQLRFGARDRPFKRPL